jgi:radical SAM superfamily enzyme YgiQ (UPF0313 family)
MPEKRILINTRSVSITVGLDEETLFTYDRRGRLIGAFAEGKNYRRGLDNRVLVKWSEGSPPRRRRLELAGEEKAAFLERVRAAAEEAVAAARRGCARITMREPDGTGRELSALPEEDFEVLEKAAALGPQELEEDREAFYRVYRPVPILPPDKYLAVVLQATEGCSYNRCAFCTFYRGVPFRVKSEEEFREHVHRVKEFLGPALMLRRSIFLGDANALVAPHEHVVRLMHVVGEEFALAPRELCLRSKDMRRWLAEHREGFEGIYSFLDVFNARKMTVEEFRQLAVLGLRRVYIGLETGDKPLLRFLRKPGHPEDAVRVVNDLKKAGVNVGVIVMTGIGGKQYAEAHVSHTVEVLLEMNLGEGDLVYFSPFVEEGTEYRELAEARGVQPLSEEEMAAQRDAIQSALRARWKDWPATALYDIREFVY